MAAIRRRVLADLPRQEFADGCDVRLSDDEAMLADKVIVGADAFKEPVDAAEVERGLGVLGIAETKGLEPVAGGREEAPYSAGIDAVPSTSRRYQYVSSARSCAARR